MLTLTEVKEQTDEIFDFEKIGEEGLVVPEPSLHWKRKLEALEETNLIRQWRECLFDMRCEQAKMMGFERIDTSEMAEMLMGSPSTENFTRKDLERHNHEWLYNHITGNTLRGDDCNWGGPPTDFVRMEKKNVWFLPPFKAAEMWRVRFGCLDYLRREIPYGVVLRMQEVRKLDLFNCFSVMAPEEAWERKTDIDPIVVASIWSFADTDGRKMNDAGTTAHFFLAQW